MARFYLRAVVRSRLQPFQVVIHAIARGLAVGKRPQKLLRQAQRPSDTRVDVVTSLKIDVFKQVTTDCAGRNGIAVHLDAGYMRNRIFHRHQALPQVFIYRKFFIACAHQSVLPDRSVGMCLEFVTLVLSEKMIGGAVPRFGGRRLDSSRLIWARARDNCAFTVPPETPKICAGSRIESPSTSTR